MQGFKSLQNDQIMYTLTAWEYTRGGLASWIAQIDTYGDGMTAHSHPYAVSDGSFGDFCASLATELLATPDKDTVEKVLQNWPHPTDLIKVAFLSKLRNKEDKHQFFSVETCKVTTSPSKRHDKRWFEVPSYANGTVEAIAGMMSETHAWPTTSSLLERYARFVSLRDQMQILGEYGGSLSCFKTIELEDRQAFQALAAAVQMWRERDNAERTLVCYSHNIANQKT